VNAEDGDFLTLTNDVGVSQTIRTTGAWAQEDVALFKTLLAPGMHVADFGANIGYHSVVFSRCVGPAGGVLAVEPQRLLYQVLQANLALNGCLNVDARRCAVGEVNDRVRMWPTNYGQPDNFGALSVAKHEGEFHRDHVGEDIDLIRTDDLLLPYASRVGRLDFIKLDIQAYELFCLKGGAEAICRYRPTLFLEISPHWMNRMGYMYTAIYELLDEWGYRVYEPHTSLDQRVGPRVWDGDPAAVWDILARP